MCVVACEHVKCVVAPRHSLFVVDAIMGPE